MKIELTNYSRTAHINHGNQTIDFSMEKYRSIKKDVDVDEAVDPFSELNKFFESLPVATQEKIFNVYKNCHEIFTSEFRIENVNEKLSDELKKLFDLASVKQINDWVYQYAINRFIYYPQGILNSFDEIVDKSLATPEQTYVVDDYRGLISLIIAIRMVTPIWGEYINLTYNEYGSSYKELYAYNLLYKANIMESDELKRLMVYIEHTIPPSFDYTSAILDGISRDDFPVWTMSRIMLNCIGLIDVSGYPTDKVSVIVVICKFITQRTPKSDRSFVGRVYTKQPPSASASADPSMEQLAIQEAYHTRQPISEGTVQLYHVYLDNPLQVAFNLDPTIPPELVQESMQNAQDLMGVEIGQGALVLAKWVMNSVVPSRAFNYLTREALVSAIIVARAWLWHHGYYDLSALSSAVAMQEFSVTGANSRSRLSQEQTNALTAKFPYYRHVPGKKREAPCIIGCITNVVDYLTTSTWRLTLPDGWLKQNRIGNRGIMYNAPETIRLELSRLALELAERTSPYVQE